MKNNIWNRLPGPIASKRKSRLLGIGGLLVLGTVLLSGLLESGIMTSPGVESSLTLPPGSFTGDPQDQSLCTSGSVTFSSSVTGDVLSYQWELSTDNGSTWNPVPSTSPYSNERTLVLTINQATATMDGYLYRNTLIADPNMATDMTASAKLTVGDTKDPDISGICGSTKLVVANGSCAGVAGDYKSSAMVSDNCTPTANLTLTQNPAQNSPLNFGSNNATMTVEDAQGNQASCAFTISLVDNANPTVLCRDITVVLDANGSDSITVADIDAGSSDNCTLNPLSLSQTTFDCTHTTESVTLTATDNSNNTASCTATVTVQDTIFPTAICRDATVYLDGGGTATVSPSYIDANSTDNCSPLTFTVSRTTFNCPDIGNNTVQLTVEDLQGNQTTCNSMVTVLDTTPPSLLCLNRNIFLDASGNANVGLNDLISNGNTAVLDIIIHTDNFPEETSWRVLDVNGAIVDSVGPGRYRGQRNTTIYIQDTLPCGQNYTFIIVDAFGDGICCTLGNGFYEVRTNGAFVARDSSFGASDVVPLGLATCPSPTGDNCGPNNIITTVNPNTFTCMDLGQNTVNITITDNNQLSTVCQSVVTILDDIPPSAVCQPLTLILDTSGNASALPSAVNNGSSDNCGVDSLILSPGSWGCTDIGPNTATLFVLDESGNMDSCTTTITIQDTSSRGAVCQDIQVFLDAMGSATITPADVNAGILDNCNNSTRSLDRTSFDCTDLGIQQVTLTVMDSVGTTTCTADITVRDTIPPSAACQDTTFYLDSTGITTLTAAALDNGSTDNCRVDRVELSQSVFDCNQPGINPVTFMAYDPTGNVDSCPVNVTVVDTFSLVADFLATPSTNLATFTFTDESTGYITSWNWDFGDGLGTSIAQDTSYTYTITDTLPVTLIVSDGCRADTVSKYIAVVSRDGVPGFGQANITLYPNPNEGTFTINMKGLEGPPDIEIYNASGQLIQRVQPKWKGSDQIEKLTLNSPARGIYLIRITANGRTSTQKMIIH